MSNKDNINELFNSLENQFDIEKPNIGHENRFLQKLNAQNKNAIVSTKPKSKILNWWKPISIAASLILLITIGLKISTNSQQQDIAELPKEIEKAQFYFTSLINSEIEKINAEATPDTKKIIEDAMKQIEKLEENYTHLQKDILEDGDSKQVLHAMIINFQTRINLLQEVLKQIENVKQLKNLEHENISI